MSRVLVAAIGLVLLGGLLGAKGKNKPQPAPAPVAAPVPAPVPAEPVSQLPPGVGDMLATATVKADVTLDDAGAAPRSVLKFAPRPDAVATIEQTTSMSGDLSMAGPNGAMPMPFPASPPQVVRTRYSVLAPAPNGFSRVHVEVLDPGGAAPGSAASLMRGIGYDLLVDQNGKPVQLDVTGGDPAIAAMVQQLADQFASSVAVLPSEPVGAGAKWTVNMDIGVAGLNLLATQTSTLVSATADAVELDVTVTMKPGPGGMALPGVPPGAADITRFEGRGQGRTRVDLATTATTGVMAMDVLLEVAMKLPGAESTMSMKMHQDLQTRAVD